jgi:hypothetical protein
LTALQKVPESCHFGHLKRHHAFSSNFLCLQAGYCSEIPLKGDYVFPIQLLTLLSTYVQSLEPSIKGSMKLGLLFQPVPQEQTSRFLIPLIFLLSNIVSMFPRASMTIMDSSLHISSHSFANLHQVMEQAQTETQSGKFH